MTFAEKKQAVKQLRKAGITAIIERATQRIKLIYASCEYVDTAEQVKEVIQQKLESYKKFA